MKILPGPVEGVVQQIVDEGLLLLRDDGAYLVVNATGAIIWDAVASGKEYEELLKELLALSHVPSRESVDNAVQSYIRQLSESGFLKEL